jgi:hypothetical protein
LYLCLTALGRTRDNLPSFLENRGNARNVAPPEDQPHDPHVGSPHPPLTLACDQLGRPECYRAPRGDGATLEDFHHRKKARNFIVDRSELARLMNALATWMKLEGRKDLARHLRREARVVEQYLRRPAPNPSRKAPGRNA